MAFSADQKGWAALAAIIAAAWYTNRPSSAQAAGLTTQGPSVSIGGGADLQQRPLPNWPAMTADAKASYVRTMQGQLQYLGYGNPPTDGNASGADTVASINQFLADHAGAATAYNFGGGGGQDVDVPALINAVDDVTRAQLNQPQAPDYRAALSTTGASYSPPASGALMIRNNPHIGVRPAAYGVGLLRR
jgi:hypothetical protein